jgi:predicted nucleotidyltransferase
LDIIKNCKDILIEYESIVFAYVFGSYVSGKLRNDSDIDIAIYLSDEMPTDEYLDLKMKLTTVFKREVDLIILNSATPLLKFEICKKHIRLFTRDEIEESNFKVKTLFEYNDVKRYLELSYRSNIDRLKKEVDANG